MSQMHVPVTPSTLRGRVTSTAPFARWIDTWSYSYYSVYQQSKLLMASMMHRLPEGRYCATTPLTRAENV